MRATIDLNADHGEGFGVWTIGDDEALLDVVTSANVACGFHAGGPTITRRVCGPGGGSGRLPSSPGEAQARGRPGPDL